MQSALGASGMESLYLLLIFIVNNYRHVINVLLLLTLILQTVINIDSNYKQERLKQCDVKAKHWPIVVPFRCNSVAIAEAFLFTCTR